MWTRREAWVRALFGMGALILAVLYGVGGFRICILTFGELK